MSTVFFLIKVTQNDIRITIKIKKYPKILIKEIKNPGDEGNVNLKLHP